MYKFRVDFIMARDLNFVFIHELRSFLYVATENGLRRIRNKGNKLLFESTRLEEDQSRA